MVFLEYYQEIGTPGYVVGMTVSLLTIVFGTLWMLFVGRKSNDKYIFSPPLGYRYLWVNACVLFGRLFAAVLICVGLYYTVETSAPADTKGTQVPLYITDLKVLTFKFETYNVTQNDSAKWKLTYFTYWNFILILFYMVLGLMISTLRVAAPHMVPVFQKLKDGKYIHVAGPATKAERSGFVQALFHTHQYCGEIALPTAIFVTFFVWSYIIPASPYDMFAEFIYLAPVLNKALAGMITPLPEIPLNGYDLYSAEFIGIAVHGLNSVFMLADFFLSGYRFNPTHWPLPLIWGTVYCFFSLIMNAKYGLICYPSMRTDRDEFIFFFGSIFFIVAMNFWVFYFVGKFKAHWDFGKVTKFLKRSCDNETFYKTVTDSDSEVKVAIAVEATPDSINQI